MLARAREDHHTESRFFSSDRPESPPTVQSLRRWIAAFMLSLPLAALCFFGSRPPPPPPPPATVGWLKTLLTLMALTLAIVVVLGLYIATHWQTWLNKALKAAFKKTDRDGSGKIDKHELYTGVLETYLQLHLYGINVRAPKREAVEKIMEAMDADSSGFIDEAEFHRVMKRILFQTVGRVVAQFGLTVLCPMTAPYVCAAVRYVLFSAMASASLQAPAALANLGANLPSSLDETIIAGVMMMSINPALALIDSFSSQPY